MLLHRQVELVTLEQRLLDMDHEDSQTNPLALMSTKVDEGRRLEVPRKALLQDIDQKLKEYGKNQLSPIGS